VVAKQNPIKKSMAPVRFDSGAAVIGGSEEVGNRPGRGGGNNTGGLWIFGRE